MAFMMDYGSRKPDAGELRGTQKEIACECWFTSRGKIIPLMIKLEDEDGVIRSVSQITVHSREKKNYAGTMSVEYDVTLGLTPRSLRTRLIYYPSEGRWFLNLPDTRGIGDGAGDRAGESRPPRTFSGV